VLAVLTSKNLAAAAKRAGIGHRTLIRWMTQPDFREALADARRATFDAGMQRVQALTTEAVETLSALMKSGPPAVRLGAARTVLELGMHHNDAETIRAKLAEVEELQRQQETRRR
jgi:hypothetical protein